jgi:DNA replication protein DnaC
MQHIAQHLQSSPQEDQLENFDDIELTQEEQAEVLRVARAKKNARLREQAYWENVNKARELVKFNAEGLFEHAKKHIEIDEHNEVIVKTICMYFTGDKRFEGINSRYSLLKGLYIFGNPGVGKTFLMQMFSQNQVQSYSMVSARTIETEFSKASKNSDEGGETSISYYSHIISTPINGNPYGHTNLGLCIDDIGTETLGKHFGKEKNVITEVILNRYDNGLPRNMTHVTTNLTTKEVEERYGTRVRDRMREMFNLIEFKPDTPSRRK